jgi:hypothetical protein
MVLATGRFDESQVAACDRQNVYAVAGLGGGPRLTLEILRRGNGGLVAVSGIAWLDPSRNSTLLSAVGLINQLTKNHIRITTRDGLVRLLVIVAPLTPETLRKGCDTAMMIGSDIACFILAALENPALRTEPQVALRSYVAYVSDPHRDISKAMAEATRRSKLITVEAVHRMFQTLFLSAESFCRLALGHDKARGSSEIRPLLEENIKSSVKAITQHLDADDARLACEILLTHFVSEKIPAIEMNVRGGKSGVEEQVLQ